MSEKELQQIMANYLKNWFYVETEVHSTDNKRRIDIIMIHKSDIGRKYPVGIEIKTDDKKTGSTLGQWLNQAIDYTTKDFQNFGKVLVITYPQISEKCLSEGILMHKHPVFEYGDFACQNNVNTFLGQFNIGELQKYDFRNKKYLRIVFNAKLIWNMMNDDFKINNYLFSCKR